MDGMIDLHCHLLPGIDDGAKSLEMSLQMAQMAIDDGISTIACTPHIYPGMYENTAAGIRLAIAALQAELDQRDMPLRLLEGADVHLQPNLADSIRDDRVPTLAGSRYLLLEPPHHVAPPRFEASIFELMVAGYVPVITHPERLTWIADHYALFTHLANIGVWMQITAGSVTGRFGRHARHWAERMLDDGLVDILATDSHHPQHRPPLLAEAHAAATARVGASAALHMVVTRPRGIINNASAEQLPARLADKPQPAPRRHFWKSVLRAR